MSSMTHLRNVRSSFVFLEGHPTAVADLGRIAPQHTSTALS